MSDAGRNKRKRFKLLIYPRFQLLLLLVNFLTVLLVIVITEYQMLNFFKHMRALGEKAGFGQFHAYYKFVSLQESTIVSGIFLSLGICLLFSTIVYLIISHKVSGPMIRLSNFFKKMSDTKQIDKLQFRKYDFFSDLPDTINEALLTVSLKEDDDGPGSQSTASIIFKDKKDLE